MPIVAGLCAVVLSITATVSHEMWRDELQAWCLARDSSSIPDLFHNMRCDGHPPLWHLALLAITRFTSDPVWMKVLHVAMATAVLALVLFASPFSASEKVLLCFSYYLSYEYFVISRGYAPGILFMFLACHLFCSSGGKWRFIAGCICVSAMMLCSAYGFLLGCAMALTAMVSVIALYIGRGGDDVVLPVLFGAQGGKTLKAELDRGFLAAAFLPLLGSAMFSVVFARPPADCAFLKNYGFKLSIPELVETFTGPWIAFFPVPRPVTAFWNTNLLYIGLPRAMMSILCLAAFMVILARSARSLVLFLSGTAAYLLFCNTVLFGLNRHHGHLFILLVASLWIGGGTARLALGRTGSPIVRSSVALFRVMLVCSAITGIYCNLSDIRNSFSGALDMARWIEVHRPNESFIAAHEDEGGTAIAGYLRRKLYYPQIRGEGSFVVWDRRRLGTNLEAALEIVKEKARQAGRSLLFVTTEPLAGLSPLHVSRGVMTGMDFWLYEIHPLPGPASPCGRACDALKSSTAGERDATNRRH